MTIKIMTIVGTRPEIIKLSQVIQELDRHADHVFVHTGQNFDYELNDIFFEQLGLRQPDYYLEAAGANAAETIGDVIVKTDRLLESEQPDACLILGDTNSCLAAISAKRRKVPVFHMEAGNRCFDQRVPEEINRKIVDHLSDINLTYTEHARRYLILEGLKPETIIKTGSPMREVLEAYLDEINRSDILDRLDLSAGKYLVVSAHREENIDSKSNFTDLIDSLNRVSDTYGKKIIFSTHPRTRQKLEKIEKNQLAEAIHILKPLGFLDYVKLQMHAFCVVSDSGTITEESSILGFPAVTIRQAHERPEGMDEGTLVMCGLKSARVVEAIDMVTRHHNEDRHTFNVVPDYDVNDVSKKVLRIILSYTDYVNRTVWHKY